MRADASKAEGVLGWKAQVEFEELVQMMVEADLERAKRGLI
jgi:GDPmannose 4,6-dehydratase